jgi:predicted anti-sigma-YlaC factor YlaD
MAFADGELNSQLALRTGEHLGKCERCEAELDRIRAEKAQLARMSSSAAITPEVVAQSFSGVMGAINAWKAAHAGPSRLGMQLRAQLRLCFGSVIAEQLARDVPEEELATRTERLLNTCLGRNSAASAARSFLKLETAPWRILAIGGAWLLMALLPVILWMTTGDFKPVRLFFDYPSPLFLTGLRLTELFFCGLVLRSFVSGDPLRPAWLLITFSAVCHVVGSLFGDILATASSINPLVWFHLAEPGLLAQCRRCGLAIGGPLAMVLLASGLFLALRVYRQAGLSTRLKRLDWTLLALVASFTVYQLYQVGIAVGVGKHMTPFDMMNLANDPVLCVLIAEAILLNRCARSMGGGLVGRCWGMFAAAIVLTSLGDIGLWASAYSYIPWPYTAIGWYIWYPAGLAYALAPAYQVGADCRARKPITLFPAGLDNLPQPRLGVSTLS